MSTTTNSTPNKFYIYSIGMAMFSMYFGAGNVVFPLLLGQVTTDQTFWALLGLLVTAVGVPFIGLFAMTMYDGDHRQFFARLGKWPALLIAAVIMGCIGPFGAIPRCIALSYANTKMFFDVPSIIPYSIVSCLIIFLATVKKTRIIDIIGWMLTPFFLLSIGFIIAMGLFYHPGTMAPSNILPSDSFVYGLQEGYNTMDLLGSFFFCSVVIQALKNASMTNGAVDQKRLVKNGLYSCLFGAFLLASVYVGMCYVAALHSSELAGVSKEVLIGTLALKVLGPYAGITTALTVIIATLTTAIALAAVFAEFLKSTVARDRISYRTSLIVTLVVAFFVSTLEFSGIVSMLGPIVQAIYPALMILSLVNIGYKVWGKESVKAPLVATVALSLLLSM